MFIFGELLVLGVGLLAFDQVVGSLLDGPLMGLVLLLSAIFMVDLFASQALVDNSFLASHAHVLIETQLAGILTLIALIVVDVKYTDPGPNRSTGPVDSLVAFIFVVAAIAGIVWFWAWFQAHMIASDMNPQNADGLFAQQMSLARSGPAIYSSVDPNAILKVTFGPTAIVIGIVSAVVCATAKVLITNAKRRRYAR